MIKKIIFYIIPITIILSCNKSEQAEIQPEKTLIIGHRAYGNEYYGSELVGNSFEAVKAGYANLDGIEVDIQMSKDSTLWLIHDNEIPNCDNKNIPVCNLSDNEILEISKCTNGTLITLDTLFEYLSEVKDKKFVSLDMKIIGNPNCFEENANKNKIIANIIFELYKKHKPVPDIAVESWDIDFLKEISNKNTEIETYLLIWDRLSINDIEYAKNNSITGLSCNYYSDTEKYIFENASQNNIKIQIWTPSTEEDITNALKLNPFAIQTENVKYF